MSSRELGETPTALAFQDPRLANQAIAQRIMQSQQPTKVFQDMFVGSKMNDLSKLKPSKPQRQATRHVLRVTLEDLYRGATKKLRVVRDTKCPHCHGRRTQEDIDVNCTKCSGRGQTEQAIGGALDLGSTPYTRKTRCDKCLGLGVFIPEDKKCWYCLGEGLTQEPAVLEVPVPRMADPNQLIVLEEQGNQSIARVQLQKPDRAAEEVDEAAGNVEVQLQVVPHDHYARIGEHIYFEKHIDVLESVLGTRFEVDFIDGSPVAFVCRHVVHDGELFVCQAPPALSTTAEEQPATPKIYVRFRFRYPEEPLGAFEGRESAALDEALAGASNVRELNRPDAAEQNYFDMKTPIKELDLLMPLE